MDHDRRLNQLLALEPSATAWKRIVGQLLNFSEGEIMRAAVLRAEEALAHWPDELRMLTGASKRRLAAPPYPPWLRVVRVFDMRRSANQIREADSLKRLFREGNMRSLRDFHIRYCVFGDEGAAFLAGINPGLHRLSLGNCGIGDDGARALAKSPHLGELTRLNLYANRIGDEGALALARSAVLGRLEHLNLYGNLISGDALLEIRSRLDARGCRLVSHNQGGPGRTGW